MPSCDEHKLKMEHNKEFLSICRANNPKDHKGVYYYDWEIVVEFYACVHLVEAVLKKKFDIDCIRRSPTAAGAVLNGRSAELRRPVRTCSILS